MARMPAVITDVAEVENWPGRKMVTIDYGGDRTAMQSTMSDVHEGQNVLFDPQTHNFYATDGTLLTWNPQPVRFTGRIGQVGSDGQMRVEFTHAEELSEE